MFIFILNTEITVSLECEKLPVIIVMFLWRSWPLSCGPDTGSLAGRTESGPFFPSIWQQYVIIAQPSAAPGGSTSVVPRLVAATDLQATLTLKPQQSSTKSASPVGRGLFLTHESMTSDHSRSSPLPHRPHLLSRHWTALRSLSGSTPRQKLSTSVFLQHAIQPSSASSLAFSHESFLLLWKTLTVWLKDTLFVGIYAHVYTKCNKETIVAELINLCS